MTRSRVRNHDPFGMCTLLTHFSGRQNATQLLAEDPQRERQRQVLLSQRKALIQGQEILRDLQQRKYGGETMSQSSSASATDDFGLDASRMPTPLSDGMDEI
jgi:hypothetical protein